jgi:hypothetical protein
VVIVVYASHVITECTAPQGHEGGQANGLPGHAETALESPRYLIEALCDDDFKRRLQYVLGQLQTFRDSSDALAGVKMTAPAVEQMIQANVQIGLMNEMARGAGQPALPVPTAPPAPPRITTVPAKASPPPTLIACPHCSQPYQMQPGQRGRFQCQRCHRAFEI